MPGWVGNISRLEQLQLIDPSRRNHQVRGKLYALDRREVLDVMQRYDNHLARREREKANSAIWVDAGNHFNAGQVIIGNTSDSETALRYIDGQNGIYP